MLGWEWMAVFADWQVIIMKVREVVMSVEEVGWASETASVYVLE